MQALDYSSVAFQRPQQFGQVCLLLAPLQPQQRVMDAGADTGAPLRVRNVRGCYEVPMILSRFGIHSRWALSALAVEKSQSPVFYPYV